MSDVEKQRLLVVDDETEVGTMLTRAFERRGYVVDAVQSADEALTRAASTVYDGAILDLVMPGGDGAALVRSLREKMPGLPVAVLTGYQHSPLIDSTQGSGIRVFSKPAVIHEIDDFFRSEMS